MRGHERMVEARSAGPTASRSTATSSLLSPASFAQRRRRKHRNRATRSTHVSLVSRSVIYTILVLFSVATIYPLVWLLLSSFKSNRDFQLNPLGLPETWQFQNYTLAWQTGDFTRLFVNSILYSGLATTLTILLALGAGFAFAKLRSRATPVLYGSFVIGILLTVQSILVPLFLVTNWVGLYNTFWAVLIVYVGVSMPIAVYLCTQYIQGIPDAIIESARMDGAGYWTIFWSIIAPMARPVIVTLAILTVQGLWNEFILINILVSSRSLRSLPVGILSFSGAVGTDYGKQFAALVIGVVPMLAFYLLFRHQITRGVAAGATKG